VVAGDFRYLSLRGLDVDASNPTSFQPRLDLAQVYTDLLTTTQGLLRRAEKLRHEKSDPVLDAVLDVLGGDVIGPLSVSRLWPFLDSRRGKHPLVLL
jgi:hypothetical protein